MSINKYFQLSYLSNALYNIFFRPALSYPIPEPTKGARRFVIPDIHGCYRTFRALLARIELTFQDQLFLLGDYVHKGPNSKIVLDDILSLQTQGYQIYALRGNHEDILLNCALYTPKDLWNLSLKYNTQNLLENHRKLKSQYLHFIQQLPYYFELKDFYLVHAGFNFRSRYPFRDRHAMLYIRDYEVKADLLHNKRIIHGHNPQALNTIQEKLNTHDLTLPLDNGCVYYGERPNQGSLLCLNLDNFELIIQKNIEEDL